jgi:hypothetical protein
MYLKERPGLVDRPDTFVGRNPFDDEKDETSNL